MNDEINFSGPGGHNSRESRDELTSNDKLWKKAKARADFRNQLSIWERLPILSKLVTHRKKGNVSLVAEAEAMNSRMKSDSERHARTPRVVRHVLSREFKESDK